MGDGLVQVGGVKSGVDAFELILCGAQAVQVHIQCASVCACAVCVCMVCVCSVCGSVCVHAQCGSV